MTSYHIVIDTNILVSALHSKRGAAYKLLMLTGTGKFTVHLSVALVLEYEEVAKRLIPTIPLTESDIDNILDYLCAVGEKQPIFYLWRPHLKDSEDDMLLELAVAANCQFIITYNQKDFTDLERFGLQAITPKELLEKLGELP